MEFRVIGPDDEAMLADLLGHIDPTFIRTHARLVAGQAPTLSPGDHTGFPLYRAERQDDQARDQQE